MHVILYVIGGVFVCKSMMVVLLFVDSLLAVCSLYGTVLKVRLQFPSRGTLSYRKQRTMRNSIRESHNK